MTHNNGRDYSLLIFAGLFILMNVPLLMNDVVEMRSKIKLPKSNIVFDRVNKDSLYDIIETEYYINWNGIIDSSKEVYYQQKDGRFFTTNSLGSAEIIGDSVFVKDYHGTVEERYRK